MKLNQDTYSKVCRSSYPKAFCEKGVLKNFAKCKGKHQCWGLFFNTVAGLRPATLLKMRLRHRSFPVNFAKILRACSLVVSDMRSNTKGSRFESG